MTLKQTAAQMMRFKRWANRITFKTVMALPGGESLKPRASRFGSMVHTLNHVFVVDDIFRAHLEGRAHGYTARNTETPPPLADLWSKQQEMDDWWVDFAEGLSEEALAEVIEFDFVGSKPGDKCGAMSRTDIIMHIVNHGNYHRGFVGDMFYQAGVTPPATDYPVFLRDAC
jgi:uncharacterized damage-inducible protein DinB